MAEEETKKTEEETKKTDGQGKKENKPWGEARLEHIAKNKKK